MTKNRGIQLLEFERKESYKIGDLLEIMKLLRGPGGCPWDREQTHESIRRNMIEEAYEAAEAIDMHDDSMLREELGDVLLQVVFHSQMASERGGFDFDGVCDGICKKLIERHPHIFGNVRADTSEQVLANWAEIKKSEKGQTGTKSVMEGIAKSLPALMRGQKVAKAAMKAGIEEKPEITDGVREKICRLLWEAVRLAAAAKTDAEEDFTGYIDGYIAKIKE